MRTKVFIGNYEDIRQKIECERRFKGFKVGNFDLEGMPRSGRPCVLDECNLYAALVAEFIEHSEFD
ncbi:hypothetical protein KIN20_020833 [Parelaphostrongylus tenuis]|uniref:Uncharacterized protein n=1 Tax=Parelaphostrongylus tenuis TaxID=148309 RepID=A0AAD5QVT1_PARTN|nr:hypothetical protein KIN20_020833 [Parelaphostrongylus tenuis]